MMKQLSRNSLVMVMVFLIASPTPAEEPSFATVRPFLKEHCFECHGADRQSAQLRLDQFDGYQSDQKHLWTAVHEKLFSGAMPPKGRPRPEAEATQQFLRWIEREAVADRTANAGNVRRLNRREFAAALQDLTGSSVPFADDLPGDGTVEGFDTGADGLQDAADSITEVMRITRRAVDAISFLDTGEAPVFNVDLREVKDARKALDPWKDHGLTGKLSGTLRPGIGLLVSPNWVGERGGVEFHVAPPSDRRGVLRITLTVAALRPIDGVPEPHLWVEIGSKDVDYRPITATPDAPIELTYEVQIESVAIEPKGLRIALSNRVEVPYEIAGFENDDRTRKDVEIPGGPGLFRPVYDRKKPPEEIPAPFLVLRHVRIEPQYVSVWPPTDWNADVGDVRDDLDTAKRLLALWMERAWRRPVEPAERERFVVLYQQLREQGLSFDHALRAAFQSVLLSSGFRYLPSSRDTSPVVAQHAIASRLSFMLWGTSPDEELRQLAATGKLRDPAVLDAQVDRLLDDPRSDGFVRPFVNQWLELGQPITIAMKDLSQQDFRFGRHLKESMREETIAYVGDMINQNRPARELIESDWTMMNEILARHYDYDGIEGSHLRKVTLRKDDPRGGGILAHAGIQSMLCWMGENWVIYLGAWALRHILDDPPPPPPLEVPELIPSDHENRGKSFRELLVQHQNDTRCSVCHRKMDPLGFAFQNFDLSGRWRDVEYEHYVRNELDGKIAWNGTGKTRPVDAVGHLPRGESFQNFDECKAQIVEHYQADLVRGLLKKWFLYATGHKPGIAEMAEIRTIIREQARREYPMRDLIKAVVRSKAFLDT